MADFRPPLLHLLVVVIAISACVSDAFVAPSSARDGSSSSTRLYSDTRGRNGKTKFGQKTDAEVSRFLTDFRTADGQVVDPYKMLQVKRDATTIEIKKSYYRLSRKLHPDRVAQADVLPGRCQNLDDVREEWERVKFSYEILRDPKVRKSYDRNSSVAEVLEDPGGAVGRAIVGGAMGGVGMVLGGAWKLGDMATKAVYETTVAERETSPARREEAKPEPRANGETETAAVGQTTIQNNVQSVQVSESRTTVAATQKSSNAINMITPESVAAGAKKRKKAPRRGAKGFAK